MEILNILYITLVTSAVFGSVLLICVLGDDHPNFKPRRRVRR